MNRSQDVLIIGGGIIGLAIAVELRLRGASVTLLNGSESPATRAAAGMLAPQAEAIPSGPFLELSLRSRRLYSEWIRKIEELSGMSTGYWPCGILAPVYELPSDFSVPHDASAYWLDRAAITNAQSGLGSEVVGGWWFPEDGQVDNRALFEALLVAAEGLGVEVHHGVTVTALQQQQGKVIGVQTTAGDRDANHYVLATGAWSANLLPVPVFPRKGQMLSVAVPASSGDRLPLKQVLYGSASYIVPRRDGRIVIGATSESVGFTPSNTPAGVHTLLHEAIRLYPTLRDFPIQECWWGFRPETPDEMPILGPSLCKNLTLAVGHYRNGILLAPVTASLIAEWVDRQQADSLLSCFSWERFFKSQVPAPLTVSSHTTVSSPKAKDMTAIQLASPAELSSNSETIAQDSPLVIAGRSFRSRLMTGTGKYSNFDAMRQSIDASGCEIVTVAVRRVQTNAPGHEGLADALDWQKIWMLPNTAGCQTAEDAIRVARLGREMAKLLGQEDNNFVKLEVIPDSKYLLPDPIGTLQAAEQLVKEGFAVLPYINADPLLAKRLEEAGCATVMPLGSPIGSGQGIRNAANIQIIIENANVPVVVDAGIGTPSEAAQAMEMGADALLINTAIAQAQNPAAMARAMGLAAIAGRLAYQSGRIPVKAYASASSPLTGTIV